MADPTTLSEWQALIDHYKQFHTTPIKTLFAKDQHRFHKFSLTLEDMLLDYSKNPITDETLKLLIALAEASGVKKALRDLQAGEVINHSEKRPALHSTLRNVSNLKPDIAQTLKRMRNYVNTIQQSQITDIVNLGIGGSELGPLLLSEALRDFAVTPQRLHFVSTLDAHQITNTLKLLNPATTLFIVSSKSFTTQETLMNMDIAKQWMKGNEFNQHFIAVTANIAAAKTSGFTDENIFPLWEWVGGRYSIWSAIALPAAIKIGMDNFMAFLSGGQKIDEHVISTPFAENIPVIMALLNIWLVNFFGYLTHAVLPYDIRLAHLPAYLQQLEMESNGKCVRQNGQPVVYHTGPIIWGQSETNGQHAFHQLLHQGSQIVPVDFIIAKKPAHDLQAQHCLLFANCLSQSQVMMSGGDSEIAEQVVPGNKPNNMIILPALTPYVLGMLIALYEYKVFISATIWDINPFDQWGVELGKRIANELFHAGLQQQKVMTTSDSSTQGLMRYFLQHESLARR